MVPIKSDRYEFSDFKDSISKLALIKRHFVHSPHLLSSQNSSVLFDCMFSLFISLAMDKLGLFSGWYHWLLIAVRTNAIKEQRNREKQQSPHK